MTKLLLILISLATLCTAFDVVSDYTQCNRLAAMLSVSRTEVNASSGLVMQLSYSRDINDPILFNTSFAWTDFKPYNTSSDVASYLAPDRYYVNRSMDAAMNSSWLLPYPNTYDRAHLFVWLYQFNATTNSTYIANGTGVPMPNLVVSDNSPNCVLYWNANGTRAEYDPYKSTPSPNVNSDRMKIALGVGLGVGLSALIGILLGLCILLRRRGHIKKEGLEASSSNKHVQESDNILQAGPPTSLLKGEHDAPPSYTEASK